MTVYHVLLLYSGAPPDMWMQPQCNLPVMKLVDIQEVTKDDFSLASQSERDTHVVRVHGIIVGLSVTIT